MSDDVPLAVLAVCCLAAAAALGTYVSPRALSVFDIEAFAFRGIGRGLAIFFTRSGYWPALTVVGLVLFAVELALRGNVAFAIVLIATQLLSQAAANAAKVVFKRDRPDDWLYHHELGFSFPSGHATTAVVFYGGLLLFVFSLPISHELQLAAATLPAIFIAGIPWSRLALSAHYATDVVGGLLLGGACFALMLAFLAHVPEARMFR